jgi:hypothetical protein
MHRTFPSRDAELSPSARRDTSFLAGAMLDAGCRAGLLLDPTYPASRRDEMSVRLVVTVTAAAGKGSELARAYKARYEECMKEPGFEQFEVFQSVLNLDKIGIARALE